VYSYITGSGSREAEDFPAEDEVARKRIEALNALSSFVHGLKH